MAVLFCAWALVLGLLGQQPSVLCGQQSMCMVKNWLRELPCAWQLPILLVCCPVNRLLSGGFPQPVGGGVRMWASEMM
jgi:hypothetical protein